MEVKDVIKNRREQLFLTQKMFCDFINSQSPLEITINNKQLSKYERGVCDCPGSKLLKIIVATNRATNQLPDILTAI